MAKNEETTAVSPAVTEAKARRGRGSEDEFVLSTGVRATIKSVPPGLLEDVIARIEEPEVPVWYNENKGREEPNPNDPQYIKDMKKFERAQSAAIIETVVLFGLNLVDPIPEEDQWLKKLRFLNKRGVFDLEGYDLEDDLDKEFLYKRYIAIDEQDIRYIVSAVTGVSPEEVEKARSTFLDDQTGDGDRGPAA